MGVGERAAVEDEGAHGVGQFAGGDGARRLGGVEGEDDVDLAIGQKLLHRRIVAREGRASAPQKRIELVEIGEEGGGDLVEHRLVDRLQQHGTVADELGQHLLEEGRAGEVRRLRIGEAAGMGLRPVEQRACRARHVGRLGFGRVVEKDQLGHAPWAFESHDGNGEVDAHGWLALGVDIAPVGQRLRPAGRHQQLLPLHRGEILAIDPDEIDRARIVDAGRLLGHHLGDRAGGVVQLDVDDADAVALLEDAACPVDIGVDVLGTAPAVEIDRLAARLVKHGGPVGRVRVLREGGGGKPCDAE